MTFAELIALLESGADFDKSAAAGFLRSEDASRKETTKKVVVAEAKLKELNTEVEGLRIKANSADTTVTEKAALDARLLVIEKERDAEKAELQAIKAEQKKATETKTFVDAFKAVSLDESRVSDHVEAKYLSGALKFGDDGKIHYSGKVFDSTAALAESVKTANPTWVSVANGAGTGPARPEQADAEFTVMKGFGATC